jgi:(p)ppGpp synthase/HD superfamily hydrolase
MEKTLDQTLAEVRRLHEGHLDRIGRPYHTHLERVLSHLVRLFPDCTAAERHAALLHGSVEEKKTTFEELRRGGYSAEVIELVSWNTRPRGPDAPPYLLWIQRLADHAPLGAVKIKIADNEDNNDPARIAQLPEKERDVSEVYEKARAILVAALRRRTAPAT